MLNAMLQYMLSLVNVCYNARIFLSTAVFMQVKKPFYIFESYDRGDLWVLMAFLVLSMLC